MWRTKPFLLEAASGGEKTIPKPVVNQQHAGQKERWHLNPAEYEYHKKNKLCYKCSEKYFYGYVCANKLLQVLTAIEGCQVEFFDTLHDKNVVFTDLMEL